MPSPLCLAHHVGSSGEIGGAGNFVSDQAEEERPGHSLQMQMGLLLTARRPVALDSKGPGNLAS